MNTHRYRINGMDYAVSVNSCTGNHAEVTVNGVSYQVEILAEGNPVSSDAFSSDAALSTPIDDQQPLPSAPVEKTEGRSVNSPLPGVIVSINVRPGDVVRSGQVVAVLEAMKMENEIQADFDGTVTSVNVSQGDSILEGAPIVTIS